MENLTVKNAVIIIIPTGITYLSFFTDLKIFKNMETWKPIIAAAIVCCIMIYIVYKRTQREKLYDALQANMEKQRIAIEFMLSKLNLTDELNKRFEEIKNSIKNNPALTKTLTDKE